MRLPFLKDNIQIKELLTVLDAIKGLWSSAKNWASAKVYVSLSHYSPCNDVLGYIVCSLLLICLALHSKIAVTHKFPLVLLLYTIKNTKGLEHHVLHETSWREWYRGGWGGGQGLLSWTRQVLKNEALCMSFLTYFWVLSTVQGGEGELFQMLIYSEITVKL